MAQSLHMTPQQVKIWFQNRRYTLKRQLMLQQAAVTSSTSPDDVGGIRNPSAGLQHQQQPIRTADRAQMGGSYCGRSRLFPIPPSATNPIVSSSYRTGVDSLTDARKAGDAATGDPTTSFYSATAGILTPTSAYRHPLMSSSDASPSDCQRISRLMMMPHLSATSSTATVGFGFSPTVAGNGFDAFCSPPAPYHPHMQQHNSLDPQHAYLQQQPSRHRHNIGYIQHQQSSTFFQKTPRGGGVYGDDIHNVTSSSPLSSSSTMSQQLMIPDMGAAVDCDGLSSLSSSTSSAAWYMPQLLLNHATAADFRCSPEQYPLSVPTW